MNYIAGICEQIDDRRSYPQWKRYVTEHCVFGVDKDSIAVMLTKLSLWINSAMKDEPFATIDTHVRCGNSLVCGPEAGFRLADFEKRAYPEKYRELKRLRKVLASLESPAQDDRPLIGALDAIAVHRQLREASPRLDAPSAPCRRSSPTNCAGSGPAFGGDPLELGSRNSPRSSKIAAASTFSSAIPPGARTSPASAIICNPAPSGWPGDSTIVTSSS